MKLRIVFVGQADALATLYEGIGANVMLELAGPNVGPTHQRNLPCIGDLLRLRMHPGPDIRDFRCTARLWDFSATGEPFLELQLDMP